MSVDEDLGVIDVFALVANEILDMIELIKYKSLLSDYD